MIFLKRNILFLTVGVLTATLGGCRTYDNATTYFNTYYNANRLLEESKEEFEFQDEGRRKLPRVLVPDMKGMTFTELVEGQPAFLKEYIIDQQKLQPVRIKVDSIIIKGSKILALHPQSNYIEGSLFLMSNAYFFRSEWVPSQIKAQEAVEQFPTGKFSPDNHLILSKSLLIQKKYSQGEIMLSRTVDVAWQQERWDVLSEAFRLQAETALLRRDMEGALKPYRQAIAQSSNGQQQARWQVELASLLYRMGRFEEAEQNFAKAREYNPDVMTTYEADLYRAASLIRLGQIASAETILSELERNENYTEWKSYTFAQRMAIAREKGDDQKWAEAEKHADTSFVGSKAIFAAHFERGMSLYEKNDFVRARLSFARSKTSRSPVFDASARYYTLLNTLEEKQRNALPLLRAFKKIQMPDDNRLKLSRDLFDLARVHEQLGNNDSAEYYHEWAFKAAPDTSRERSRFVYGYARSIVDSDPDKADSLLELIVYHNDDFGADARRILGFTADALIDSVAELYLSGARFRAIGDFAYAARQFNKVVKADSMSDFAPRSLYALGWMFENQVHRNDSAIFYYTWLTEKYPDSKYAQDIRYGLQYAVALQKGFNPDSILSPGSALPVKEEKGDIPVDQRLSIPDDKLLQAPSGSGSRLRSRPGTNLPVMPRSMPNTQLPQSEPSPIPLPSEGSEPEQPVTTGKKP
ncbi:MAG TPA: tetratricopeptide repeat protein [Patescibacteria group bacterium]|nr:tetratricopeptide repeat protein [Patescibacteria group bacterium]